MFLTKALQQISRLGRRSGGGLQWQYSKRRPALRLALEPLEDRFCPSGGYLLVGSFNNNSVLRYDESTGAFVDQFDPHNLANLKTPVGGVFGPDGSLYVT